MVISRYDWLKYSRKCIIRACGGRGRGGRGEGGESERAGVCATVLFPTQAPAFSLSLCCYLYIAGARPCAGYIDRERNIDPSQRRRALTAHHLHTYIINAPTTATAVRPASARRRRMFLLFAKSFAATESKHPGITRARGV